MKRLLLLYLLLIVKKTTVGAHSLRRAESQTSLMEYPCLLLPNEDEGSEWECILDEREITFDDDRDCGQNINIEGLELTDEQEEKVRSHSTLLLPNDEHFFVGGEKLVIDGTPEFEFYPKLGGSLGEKKAIMIRVVAKDQEPSHSLEELAKETFGDGQISQYEKCSHGKMKITPFEGTINGKTIENGVYEYKLPFDWPWPYKGIDEEDPVHEVVSCNLAKELGSFWYLRHGIDFVMYCIPEPLNGRYAYANNDLMLLTVYGDGTCLETKTHLHEIGHVSTQCSVFGVFILRLWYRRAYVLPSSSFRICILDTPKHLKLMKTMETTYVPVLVSWATGIRTNNASTVPSAVDFCGTKIAKILLD